MLYSLEARQIEGKEMKVLTVASQKGGAGKTTTCSALGAVAVDQGMRVLLIDLDPQGQVAQAFGVFPEPTDDVLAGVLLGEREAKTIHEGRKDSANLSLTIIAGGTPLMELTRKVDEMQAHVRLSEGLGYLDSEFDVCIIDTPPGISGLPATGLLVADYVLAAATPEPKTWQGATRLYEVISSYITGGARVQKPNLKFLGTVFCAVDTRRPVATSRAIEALTKAGASLRSPFIPRRGEVADEVLDGQPLVWSSPRNPAARAHVELALLIFQDMGLIGAELTEVGI